MGPSRPVDLRWSLLLLCPIHQCLSILKTSYLSMTDNYYRYLSTATNTYIPFHTFVFIVTIKTIPNFVFRYPYLAFRIMTLPIEEIGPNCRFYPYLYQVSEPHLLLLQATQTNLHQYAQVAINQSAINGTKIPSMSTDSKKTPTKITVSSSGSKPVQTNTSQLLPIEDLFTIEEQTLLNEIFHLLSIPNIPLKEQQISLVQFNFYMKILGIVPPSLDTSMLYINLRQMVNTGYKNKNKYQLDPNLLDSYDIPQTHWIQQVQLTPQQRELLKRYNEFKEQQQHMLLQKEKLEQSKKGLFERFITSTATKIFSHQQDDHDDMHKKALTTPIYSGITFFVFSEFLSSFGITTISLQQQYRIMLSVISQTNDDGESTAPPTNQDDDDDTPKKLEIYQHLTHNNYLNHSNPENIPQLKLQQIHENNANNMTPTSEIELVTDCGRFLQLQDGYKRAVEQQHRILVEAQADFQRLFHFLNPNQRLPLDPDVSTTENEYNHITTNTNGTNTNNGNQTNQQQGQQQQQQQPQQQQQNGQNGQNEIITLPSPLNRQQSQGQLFDPNSPTEQQQTITNTTTNTNNNTNTNNPSNTPTTSILPTNDPNSPILWKTAPFWYSPPSQATPLTYLSPHSISSAPALFPQYSPHHYYNNTVREKAEIFSNNMIIYCTKGFDRSEFVVSGKCCLTLDSFIFIPLVSKTIIPYSSIVKVQLVPQTGVTATLRQTPYLLITYATQMKDSTVTYTSTGHQEADSMLHLLERQGYCFHEKLYIDSDDVYLLFSVLCEMISISRLKTIILSSDKDLSSANELSFAAMIVNAMARYAEAEKEVFKSVSRMEGELKNEENTVLTSEQRAKLNTLILQQQQQQQQDGDSNENNNNVTKFQTTSVTQFQTTTTSTLTPLQLQQQQLAIEKDKMNDIAINKFVQRRNAVRSTMAMMKLPSFKTIVHEMMLLFKQIHAKSNLTIDNPQDELYQTNNHSSSSNSLNQLPPSATNFAPGSNSPTININKVGTKEEKISILAQHIHPNDPNYRIIGLLQPLIHYDHERHQQALLNKFRARNNRSTTTSTNGSTTPNSSTTTLSGTGTNSHNNNIYDGGDFSCLSSTNTFDSSLPSTGSSSRTSFHSTTTSNVINDAFSIEKILSFQRELKYYDIDYSLPVADGIHPPICNTATTTILSTIPNLKKIKLDLIHLLFRDVLNSINVMISVYYLLQQNHLSTPVPIPIILTSLSCMRPILVQPQREILKTVKAKKGTTKSTSSLFDLRDVFFKGREQQQKTLFLYSIQHLLTNCPEKLPLHIRHYFQQNQHLFYLTTQSNYSLSTLKAPSMTGIGGSSPISNIHHHNHHHFPHSHHHDTKLDKDRTFSTSSDVHSLSTTQSSSITQSVSITQQQQQLEKDKENKRTDEIQAKHEKSLPHNQFLSLVQQQYHFIDNHTLHSPDYVNNCVPTIDDYPWVLNVISHSLLEERAASYLIKVFNAKNAFEKTIKQVPLSVKKEFNPTLTINMNNIINTSQKTTDIGMNNKFTNPTSTPSSPNPTTNTSATTSLSSPSSTILMGPLSNQPNSSTSSVIIPALNATMTNDKIADMTLFEYSTFTNQYIEEQYYGYHVFTQDMILYQQHYTALLQRLSQEEHERQERERLRLLLVAKEAKKSKRHLFRRRHKNPPTLVNGSNYIDDQQEHSDGSDNGSDIDDEQQQNENLEELNELSLRRNAFNSGSITNTSQYTLDYDGNLSPTPNNNNNTINNGKTPIGNTTQTTTTAAVNRFGGDSSRFSTNNTNNTNNNQTPQIPNNQQLIPSSPFPTTSTTPSTTTQSTTQSSSTTTLSQPSLDRPNSATINPSSNQYDTRTLQTYHTPNTSASSSALLALQQYTVPQYTPNDIKILHRFWYYQQQLHIQRHQSHLSTQKQLIPSSTSTTPTSVIVSDLSLFLVIFVTHPTYFHTVPFYQQQQFIQHVLYQQQQLSHCVYHFPREQSPLPNEDMVLMPRTVGDGVINVLQILQEYNLNKFSIRSGIDTILLTKSLIDPIFILIKLISTISKWKHPEITAMIFFILLLLSALNILYILPPLLILLLVLFLLVHKNDPFWLELYLGPWCEGELKMNKQYYELEKQLVPSPHFGTNNIITVPKSSLLTTEEKYQYIAIDKLKKRQRARYIYFSVRGQDYWGHSLRRYNNNDDNNKTNNNNDDNNKTNNNNINTITNKSTTTSSPSSTIATITNKTPPQQQATLVPTTTTPTKADNENLDSLQLLTNDDNNDLNTTIDGLNTNGGDDIPETYRTTKDLTAMITKSHFDISNSTTSSSLSPTTTTSNDNCPQQQQQQPSPPQTKIVLLDEPKITKQSSSSSLLSSPSSTTIYTTQPIYVTSQQFLTDFRPTYTTIATSTIVNTKTSFLHVVSKLSHIQSQITHAYDKATTIQNTLTGINNKFMKIQGLFRWTTPQITQKLVFVLIAVIFALLLLPFRLIFAAIVIDVFTKKWHTPPSFLERLLNDVELANGAHYTLVSDDDVNKTFPKSGKKGHENHNTLLTSPQSSTTTSLHDDDKHIDS